MKTVGLMILLLTLELPGFAQAERQDGVIVFYTTDTFGLGTPPTIYSNGQKVGEVTRDQPIRLVVNPGTHEFRLMDAVLPVSIGPGQEVFLRVTRTAFYFGSAAEAVANPRTVTPNSASTLLNPRGISPAAPTVSNTNVSSTAVSNPEPLPERIPQAGSAHGTPGVLRCSFSGTLIIQAALQPASPVVGRIRCGDPVLLVDTIYSSPHVRTRDGKDGYILGLNLGQWSIETQINERATVAATFPAVRSSEPVHQLVQAKPEGLTANQIPPDTPEPAPTSDLISAFSSITPTTDLISASAPVPLPLEHPIVPAPNELASKKDRSSTATTLPAPSAATVNEGYVIGPEDLLEISVWREPDLTTKATVRPDGKIGMPLLNDVQASGLTTQQLRDRLQQGFAQYVNEPLVSVIVTETRSQVVHIVGSVAKPGSYRLGGPLTVMELLARAGGLVDFAKREDITIVRSEGGKTHREMFNYKTFVEGKNLQQNILLRNGDVIIVP